MTKQQGGGKEIQVNKGENLLLGAIPLQLYLPHMPRGPLGHSAT